MLLMIILGFGYALGSFMAASWRPYAISLPVSVLIFLVTNFLFASPTLAPGVSQTFYYIYGPVMYTPIIMLGVFLAQRKSKKDSFD